MTDFRNFKSHIKLITQIIISTIIIFLSLSSCGGKWEGFNNGFFIFSAGSATLNWQEPTANVDGTPATDIAGYIIYYGQSSGNYTNWIDVGNVSSYTIYDLPNGTFYFVTTSYDIYGNESEFSNELSKVIN